ncbi:MAG: glycosyltransferase [Zetaproteobacteria bacterium]|nr:MAG: glycosyltransferase [Zetaproteobacteria bacterium]
MCSCHLSIVVPLFDEQENVAPLVAEVEAALTGIDYELILIDDGSHDSTFTAMQRARRHHPRLRLLRMARNFGQTAAMMAGFDAARGRYVAYMDGDLQTDPADIPRLLERLQRDRLDLVNGWRRRRADDALTRTLPSRMANALIRRLLGIDLHDHGCPLKVMRAETAKALRLYGEQHRMLPAIAAIRGARIGEMEVHHRPRIHGRSKYGLGRTVRVLIDLLLVAFFQRFTDRPLQLFGGLGLLAGTTGLAIDGWLTVEKLLFGVHLAGRPLLQLGSLLIVSGILLFGIGLILELQIRTYYESTGARCYALRENDDEGEEREDAHSSDSDV